MEKAAERIFFLEFIGIYQSFPALWDTSTKEYADRNVKHKQYGILLEKYWKWDPKATMEDMKKKINTLRTNYRREMKRLAALKEGGAGAEEYNDSSLYYFKALHFLRDSEAPTKRSRSTMDFSNKSSECETTPMTSIKRIKVDDVEDDELIALAKIELSKPIDDFDRIGETWASKMRKMDRMQQLWAEKFVNEILLEGQLGNLHRHSVQILECLYTSNEFQSGGPNS